MREKQIEEQAIEEIAKVIEGTEQTAAHCGKPSPKMYAQDLYWRGYRKQSEGEWLQDEESKFVHRYHCSVCNFYLIGEPTKYCEDCGAKMRGVRKVQNENIVKVVRCKDCEFRETKECPQITLPLDDYGFCSFGEQKMKGGAE